MIVAPLFSIIIPTYNRADLLSDTIQSVLAQTYPHFEIIVVDDGSTDNTHEVVHAFQNNKILYYKISNHERGFARNYGAKQSTGKYLYFLDSDDILYPNHLSAAFSIIQKYPNIEIFHLSVENSYSTPYLKKYILNNQINKALIYGNILGCQGLFIRKDIFLQYLFNEDRTIAGLEDWELWLRLATKYKIVHFPMLTSSLNQHASRSVLQTDKQNLIKRVETFMNYVLNNPDITAYYKNQIHHFKASCYTYIALHLALTKKHKNTTLYYLLKGLKEKPTYVLYRRFWAILKHLLL